MIQNTFLFDNLPADANSAAHQTITWRAANGRLLHVNPLTRADRWSVSTAPSCARSAKEVPGGSGQGDPLVATSKTAVFRESSTFSAV